MIPELSIIIVNYRSVELIVDCINSALNFPSAKEFEWIIVDNNSQDNSEKLIKEKFPFAQWLQMEYNSGFARANNEGIRHAKGNVVLLLNPDMIIVDNAIQKCLDEFKVSPFAACSVQLLYKNGSPQITGSYFMKGGLNMLFFLPYVGSTLKAVYSFFKSKHTAVRKAASKQEVDWINGAFMMVKKEIIKKAGLLDEDFFLYSEELEWCYRLKRYGRIIVYGNLFSIHLQGSSINNETNTVHTSYLNVYDKKGLQLIVSRHLQIRKQFGVAWFIFHVMANTITIPVFFVSSLFDNLFQLKDPLKDIKKIKSFTLNILTLWKIAPQIALNKPHFYKMF